MIVFAGLSLLYKGKRVYNNAFFHAKLIEMILGRLFSSHGMEKTIVIVCDFISYIRQLHAHAH